MKIKNKLQSVALLTVTLTMTAVSAPGFTAQPAPSIRINQMQNGSAVFGSAVQLSGVATDSDGIRAMAATIQNLEHRQYLRPDGKTYSGKSAPLPVKFQTSTGQTNWATQIYQLPQGKYMFRLQAVDGSNLVTNVEAPFVVQQVNANTGTAPIANAAASHPPRINVQFPKNGAVLQDVAVFRGVADDDTGVTAVVATIMNTSTGLYLGSNGKFGKSGHFRLQTSKGKRSRWSSPQLNLPAGNYEFAARAIDTDGVEGGSSQISFSVAALTRTAATQPAATGKAANGMNFCSNKGKDVDGDGFGWENNASCVVAGSRADTHPNCASSSSDPDGDGFGWENERSCIVVTHCTSSATDPDGDGFGWENERSCIVLPTATNSQFARCGSSASDPDGDGYGWENNKTCLVAK